MDAHNQLGAPLIVVWDNERTHGMPSLRHADQHDWLTLVALPNYAPGLNPTAGIWSLIKRGSLANLAVPSLDGLVSVIGSHSSGSSRGERLAASREGVPRILE